MRYVLTRGPLCSVGGHVGEDSLWRGSAFRRRPLPGQIGFAAAGVGLADRRGGRRKVTPVIQIGGGCCVPHPIGSHGIVSYFPAGVSLYVLLQSQENKRLQ